MHASNAFALITIQSRRKENTHYPGGKSRNWFVLSYDMHDVIYWILAHRRLHTRVAVPLALSDSVYEGHYRLKNTCPRRVQLDRNNIFWKSVFCFQEARGARPRRHLQAD